MNPVATPRRSLLDWTEIEHQAAKLMGTELWAGWTSMIEQRVGESRRLLEDRETPLDEIRYHQGFIAGLESGIMILGELVRRADRSRARAERDGESGER